MADRQYFDALGRALEAASGQREIETREGRARAESQKQSRRDAPPDAVPCIPTGLTASAHENELAVSWQVDIAYLKACTFHRLRTNALKKAGRSESGAPLGRRQTQALADEAHARFKGVKDTPLRVDCFIYFKDHNLAPQIDPGMMPAFTRAFHGAPLHHHFAIWRMQRPNPSTGAIEFTDWYAFETYALGLDETVKTVLKQTRFNPCPPASTGEDGLWLWLGVAAGAGMLGLAALLFILHEPIARLTGFATPQDRREMEAALQRLREDVAVLREQYATETVFVEAYQNEIARLRSSGASPREIEELEAALAASQRRVDDLNRQLAAAGERLSPASGTGLPACWTGAGGRPAYLFEAYLDDRGIRLSWADGAAGRARTEGLPLHAIAMETALGVESFTEMTRPVYAASEAAEPRCRHHVILREGVHASASAYQRQREAVERHFYIYRP